MDPYKNWEFIQIYGSPIVSFGGKYSKLMNENTEIGSLWKGKLLMKIECEDKPENPQTTVKPCENSLIEDSYQIVNNKNTKWILIATVMESYFLPDNDKYKIKISCGDVNIMTDEYVIFLIIKASY